MQGNGRVRLAHLDRHAVVLQQQSDLFDQVVAKQRRLGDRGLVDAGFGHVAIGQARVDGVVGLDTDADGRVIGPPATCRLPGRRRPRAPLGRPRAGRRYCGCRSLRAGRPRQPRPGRVRKARRRAGSWRIQGGLHSSLRFYSAFLSVLCRPCGAAACGMRGTGPMLLIMHEPRVHERSSRPRSPARGAWNPSRPIPGGRPRPVTLYSAKDVTMARPGCRIARQM